MAQTLPWKCLKILLSRGNSSQYNLDLNSSKIYKELDCAGCIGCSLSEIWVVERTWYMSVRDGYFFKKIGTYLESGRGAETFFDAGCGAVWTIQKAWMVGQLE